MIQNLFWLFKVLDGDDSKENLKVRNNNIILISFVNLLFESKTR